MRTAAWLVAGCAVVALVARLRRAHLRRLREKSAPEPPFEGLEEVLTLVLTTSPSPIHPSTQIIDSVIRSIAVYSPALLPCRLIIVCDGYKASKKNAFRSGRVDASAIANYEDYKARLRERAAAARDASTDVCSAPSTSESGWPPLPRVELLELGENHGFGFAVREALRRVSTPAVCVLQHDRAFLREVDLRPVVARMLRARGAVGYVLLPTRSTAKYVHQSRSRLGVHGVKTDTDIEAYALPLPPPTPAPDAPPARAGRGEARLLPCLQWYDSTHVSLLSHYTDFVFADELGLCTKGHFIEAEMGQLQFPDVVARGLAAAVPYWRTFLYSDGDDEPIVGHLDGSRAYTHEDVLRRRPDLDPARVSGRLGRLAAK